MDAILRASIADSEADGDFDAALVRVLKARGELDRYWLFLRLMKRHGGRRNPVEAGAHGRDWRVGAGTRTQAMRLLSDLPRLYGIKNTEAR